MTLLFLSILYVVTALATLTMQTAWAGACCASGGALPSLITSDDHAQFSATVSRGSVIGDAPRAPDEGLPIFRASDHTENLSTLQLSGATLVSDLWQVGASIPVHRRDLAVASSKTQAQGLGDAVISAGFEAFPEYGYSAWRPRGYFFSTLTLPTGTSIYTARQRSQADAFGKGFVTPGFGALFKKDFGRIDVSWLAEAHHSFARNFHSGEERVHVQGFWGASTQIAIGYRVMDSARLGFKLAPQYSQAFQTETNLGTTQTAPKLVWDTTLDFTFAFRGEWTALASYTDQTFFGPVMNTTLSRTVAFGIQKSFLR